MPVVIPGARQTSMPSLAVLRSLRSGINLIRPSFHRKFPFSPCVETAFEGADAVNALLFQQECGARARDFVRTSTVENNVPIAWNLVMAMIDFLHEEIERARNRLRIELQRNG